MDPVKLEKLRVMNKYRRTQFLQAMFQYCLTVLVLILCLSKSTWFISFCSSLKLFFLFTLPHLGAYVMNPKCLFVLCNVIVIILVGESKLVGSPSSSDSSEIYDEYVLRLRSRPSLREEKQGGGKRFDSSVSQASLERIQEVVEEDEEDKVGVVEEEKEEEREQEEEEKEEDEEEEVVRGGGEGEEGDEEDVNGEEGEGLPTDELNKRVEDFIAKINRQRRMEEEMMLCSG